MGAGKSKKHRKKQRIAKHVVESQTRKKQEDAEKQLLAASEGDGETSTSTTNDANDESKKSTKNTKTKDPAEAASYLTLWDLDRNSESTTKNWKFNKNTQSWLLRHMYDFDKVSKSTFGTLVDYVCQGGDKTRLRVEEEAKRRARRYKEWEKKQQKEGDAEQDEDDVADETKDATSSSPDDEEWNQLDDHDKRKEYKRARKVLDSLKEQQ
ncbi:DUF2373 domain-containing protein [Skeletonema marinoi]|uniref:DUF2373 domain-containing protein n=1 Tax=Skeletonema marinoi TaxID=267567 RepID=A0AAD8YLU3_9STRA|nr:DUF2373 domain-containing protein [Skeletonema marinoi]